MIVGKGDWVKGCLLSGEGVDSGMFECGGEEA